MKVLTSIRNRLTAAALIVAAAIAPACGQAPTEPDSVGQHQQAAIAAPTLTNITVKLDFPVGADFPNTVLSSQTQLLVRDGVIVSTPAPAFVANAGTLQTELGVDAVLGTAALPISLTAGGNATMKDRSKITGSLVAGGTLIKGSNTVILGQTSLTQDINLASRTLPLALAISEAPINVEVGQTRLLEPGGYGVVTLKANAKLRLKSSGTYTFKSLDAQSNSIVEFADSAGPVVVQLRDTLTYRGRVTGAASRLLLIGSSTKDWIIDAPFKGTVVHPGGRLITTSVNGTGHQGAFHAKRLDLGARNPISFVPFGHWTTVFAPRLVSSCLVKASEGNLAASFTIDNPMMVAVPAGPQNTITPAQPEGSSTIWAGPGTQKRFFASTGEPISWTVSGQTMTVSATSPLCATTNACQQGTVSCEANPEGNHRHSEITFTATGGTFVATLDIGFSEDDPSAFQQDFTVKKNGTVTFAQSTRPNTDGNVETTLTWSSSSGSTTVVTETTPAGDIEGTFNGSPFGPISLGAPELAPYDASDMVFDADTDAVMGCLLQRLSDAALTCTAGANGQRGSSSPLAAAAAAGDETDLGHLSDTYNADPCVNCKFIAGTNAAVAAVTCTIASLGWGAPICWAAAALTEVAGMEICNHSGACCPEACGANGECCFGAESCLHKDKGLCCDVGNAPCGPVDHGTECCSPEQVCMHAPGTDRHNTCCGAADGCGDSCCDDRGATLLPYGPSVCANPLTSTCCAEDLVCGNQCCTANDDCVSGECVPRADCTTCTDKAECFGNPDYPLWNWCYKERDAATGCCGVMVK